MAGTRDVGGPAAIVLADAPRPGLCAPGLAPILGAELCARLQAALIRRAMAGAAAVGTPHLAYRPADAHDEVAPLAPAGTRLFAQVDGHRGERLAAAAARVLDEGAGPVVLVGVDTPQIDPVVGHRAVEDLRRGCDVTFGPTDDGGYYLIGLHEPHPELFALPAEAWGGPQVFELSFAAAHAAGLHVAVLRSERALDDEHDVRALLADPLAPPDIVAILREAPGLEG